MKLTLTDTNISRPYILLPVAESLLQAACSLRGYPIITPLSTPVFRDNHTRFPHSPGFYTITWKSPSPFKVAVYG